MAKTISTHNGSKAHRAHNIRDAKVTEKQTHIDVTRSGDNEILVDEPPREAYKRIFGEALDEYNARQKRSERQIRDYYSHIERDEKKHPVYEMIVQIGDKDNTGHDAPTEREILREFIDGWKERNPNLELIGAYIHADEATLHAHLDYIPVAHGYKNGMSTQNGLNKALNEQGFEGRNMKETPQIQWEARENRELERICNTRGIEVDHPKTGQRHLDMPEYKALCDEIEALRVKSTEMALELKVLETRVEILKNKNKASEGQLRAKNGYLDELEAEKEKKAFKLAQLNASCTKRGNDLQVIEDKIKAAEGLLRANNEVLSGQAHAKANLDTIDDIDNRSTKALGKIILSPDDYTKLQKMARESYVEQIRQADNAVKKELADSRNKPKANTKSIADRMEANTEKVKAGKSLGQDKPPVASRKHAAEL